MRSPEAMRFIQLNGGLGRVRTACSRLVVVPVRHPPSVANQLDMPRKLSWAPEHTPATLLHGFDDDAPVPAIEKMRAGVAS